MKNKILIFSLGLLGFQAADAQDANFSQSAGNPMLLSPANTGMLAENWRATGIFRNTSFDASHTFTTGAFAVEKRITSAGIDEHDRLGVGFTGLFDQSNDGALKSNYAGVSLAYGKALDVAGNSRLSAGVQAVWATRRLDVNKLVFGDQFASGGYSTYAPSADASRSGAASYLDLNFGLAYRYATKDQGFNLGAAMFHSGRPTEQFWGADFRVPRRYTFDGGGYFKVADNDHIYLSAVTNFQGDATEYLGGGYFSKSIGSEKEDRRFNIGGYYRYQSAVIPYLGLECSKWNGALSYDISAGNASHSLTSRRSLEISVQHNF